MSNVAAAGEKKWIQTEIKMSQVFALMSSPELREIVEERSKEIFHHCIASLFFSI